MLQHERERLLARLAAQLNRQAEPENLEERLPGRLAQLFDLIAAAPAESVQAELLAAARRHGVWCAEQGAEVGLLFQQFSLLRVLLVEAAPHKAEAFRQAQEAALAAATAAYVAELTRVLSERAARDPLTKLFNRASFDKLLGEELERAQRYRRELSLALLDVDRFKPVNDSFGHQAGDKVLQSIAQLLQSSLRQSDLAFRYGGDEFAALFPETSPQAARQAAQRLEQRFAQYWAERHATEGKILVSGLSWGVASFPTDGADPVTLVRVADEQLYLCKRAHHARGPQETGK